MKRAVLVVIIAIPLAILNVTIQWPSWQNVSETTTGPVSEPAIPDALSGAETVQAQPDDDPADNDAIDCPDRLGAEKEELNSTDVRDTLHSAALNLRTSYDPEHRLAAGLILSNNQPDIAFELITEASTLQPTSAIAAWRSLKLCSQRDVAACDSITVEENAISADGDNGMMWVQVASRRLADGREAEAIDAIRNAIASPRFDTYFAGQVELLDRSLATVTNWSFGERVVHSSESVSVSPANFHLIRAQCDNTSAGVWPELCDQLGQRMVAGNVDLQTKILGSSLRAGVLNRIGDVDGARAVETELAELNAEQDRLLSDMSLLNLILSDEAVLRDFLSVSQSYGEAEAIRRLEDHADRLRVTPGYDQCNFVTNPYIKL